MGSEPQGWTGELPPILRFLPGEPRCFLYFLELLSKLGRGGVVVVVVAEKQNKQSKKAQPPLPGPHLVTPTQRQPCHSGRDFRSRAYPLIS